MTNYRMWPPIESPPAIEAPKWQPFPDPPNYWVDLKGVSPAPIETPPGGYAEALEEFLSWESWQINYGQLEFRGVIKIGDTLKTVAEQRVSLMVSFDRLCRKLVEMGAPLVSHPEFHIIVDGIGSLKGVVTILLYSEPGYIGIS